MSVSVIISNFNGARWLPRLLESLEAQQGVDHEIIVVDRNSSDESAAILAEHAGVRVIDEPPESGLVAGYCAGVALARYEHLFFCNEDMWFASDCLARLEREIEVTRRVACADPWQWSYDGSTLIHAAPQIRRQWNRGSPHPWYPFEENKFLPTGRIIACACASSVMIHRQVYDEIGGWDASFFLDQEDTDLAIRLWQHGWHTVTVPDAQAFHAVGASNNKVIARGRLPVAKKRYVHALSNQFIVVWKLFSAKYCLLPFLGWGEIFLKDLFKLRLRRAAWDLLAVKVSAYRLPQVRRFRSVHRLANRYRPAELFFKQEQFQLGSSISPSAGSRNDASRIRLSIALVTRNRPQWLRRCLESWRAQSPQPFEIVISDDSDISITAQIEKIAGEFNCRYVSGPRRGLYTNRNHAALACRGTHIMSADDDHTHPSGFLAAVMGVLEVDPEAIWTVSERPSDDLVAPTSAPGELRSDGTVGPPENHAWSTAIACDSTVYPKQIFDSGLRCSEAYPFGALWYLWGHALRRAGFRIRHCANTFVRHHAGSSVDRSGDLNWVALQHECNLYVQAVHALWFSRHPAALLRTLYRAIRFIFVGEAIPGRRAKLRLSVARVARGLLRAAFVDARSTRLPVHREGGAAQVDACIVYPKA